MEVAVNRLLLKYWYDAAVCESYLTQIVDPLIVKNKSTFNNSRSGIGTLLARTRCQSTLISFDRLVIEE
jgi:hypothetical protein